MGDIRATREWNGADVTIKWYQRHVWSVANGARTMMYNINPILSSPTPQFADLNQGKADWSGASAMQMATSTYSVS